MNRKHAGAPSCYAQYHNADGAIGVGPDIIMEQAANVAAAVEDGENDHSSNIDSFADNAMDIRGPQHLQVTLLSSCL
jgi:hypothetical protein